jgi:antitoxin HicB
MNRTNSRKRGQVGSTLDSLLEEDGILDEVEAVAIKRVIAWQLAQAMKRERLTKKAMATRLRTSRSQLDRLLDQESGAVTLETLVRAARAIGKRMRLELIEAVEATVNDPDPFDGHRPRR